MATCAACGQTVVFGGRKVDGSRYCNDACASAGQLIQQAREIPEEVIWEHALRLQNGPCPRCARDARVDLRESQWVWSAVFFTRAGTEQFLGCESCGRRRLVVNTLTSLLFGWWGFPLGLIETPVQVIQNVAALRRRPMDGPPSEYFLEFVRLMLARESMAGLPDVPPEPMQSPAAGSASQRQVAPAARPRAMAPAKRPALAEAPALDDPYRDDEFERI
jgi:hypothetical protein